LRQRVFAPLGHFYPKLDWAPRFLRGKTTFQSLARTSVQAYLHGVGICSDEMRDRLFSEDLKKDLGGYRSIQVFDRALRGREFSDPLRMVQYLDYHTYLPGDILTKVDRASMAHSLEVRVPFLDYTFVEWAARIPSAAKLRGLEGKRVLKRALHGHLPNEVLYRTKMGFAVPIEEWFRRSLRERIAESLESGSLAECGMFSQERIRRIVHEHHSGRRNHSSVMWTLLMFDGFLRKISVGPAYSLRN
jgi:asparagine synthase (glutamine-hydrolysing)